MPANIARALIDGLSQDVIADDDRLANLVPQKLLGFREAAVEALEADRKHALPARWVEGAIACREFRPEYGFYSKKTSDSAHSSASAEALWRVICRVGKDGDFFYANWLWWPRRCLYWLTMLPFHAFIFRGMAREIAARAEAAISTASKTGR